MRKRHVPNYWSEQFIAGNKTEKPSDEPPTDQEHRLGDRSDQAHLVQLIARSIISWAASTKGCWTFFVRKIHVPIYWSEQCIAGNKTEKTFDEPPTDQEHRLGDRSDQAHLVQLIARSIISFGCLIVGEISFRLFWLLFFRKALL